MNTAEQFTDGDEARVAQVDQTSLSVAGEIVEIRRAAGLSAVIGAMASAVAIAWFGRAIDSGSVLDWTIVLIMSALGFLWLAAFVDARTPLLVADDQGVRLRLGRAWIGLPWSAVERVDHRPRRGLLRDGLLNVVPHNPERVLAEVGTSAARRATLSRRVFGGPFAVPLGLSTRVVGGGSDLTTGLDLLAKQETVVQLLDTAPAHAPEDEIVPESAPEAEQAFEPADGVTGSVESRDAAGAPRTRPLALLSRAYATVSARVRPLRDDRDATALDPESNDVMAGVGEVDGSLTTADPEIEASETPAPVRTISNPSRNETVSGPMVGDEDTQTLDSHDIEFFDESQTWTERVSPIARVAHPVAPLVLGDFGLEPAADPVIGPNLRAARTRIGLSTDQLAERTRIRPHVIEAIEVDDFVPCGGDFYARGHLRTLARVLGVDVAPLLVTYDERYANAPIDPRRVFEAELATGSHGSIRGTRGGPNWSILVAAVMALVLAWSVAQLVMDAPVEVRQSPVLNGSGGPGGNGSVAVDPVKITVVAPTSGAEVLVRDSSGAEVFRGVLAIGESATVKATPPVRVQASDGSVTVSVGGTKRGPIGEVGEPGQGTYAD